MAVTIESGTCTGCGTCVGACPMDALSIDNDVAVVDEGTCIDCGVCVDTCPTEAISL